MAAWAQVQFFNPSKPGGSGGGAAVGPSAPSRPSSAAPAAGGKVAVGAELASIFGPVELAAFEVRNNYSN